MNKPVYMSSWTDELLAQRVHDYRSFSNYRPEDMDPLLWVQERAIAVAMAEVFEELLMRRRADVGSSVSDEPCGVGFGDWTCSLKKGHPFGHVAIVNTQVIEAPPCEWCGPGCLGGAAHNARREDGVRWREGVPVATTYRGETGPEAADATA
jgi:hypothetical protein